MLSNLFYVGMTAVVLAALLRGGRPERRTALAIVVGAVGSGLLQLTLNHSVPASAFVILDLAVLAFHLRTWLFRRMTYLLIIVLAQAGVVALDVAWLLPSHPSVIIYHHLTYALLYLRLGALLSGVLVRWIGPPP